MFPTLLFNICCVFVCALHDLYEFRKVGKSISDASRVDISVLWCHRAYYCTSEPMDLLLVPSLIHFNPILLVLTIYVDSVCS